jgi:hypothetical protein
VDFVAILLKDTSVAAGLGVPQMIPSQRVALNRLLNTILRLSPGQLATTPEPKASSPAPRGRPTLPARAARLYESRIDTDNDEILSLENGAVVEILGGYLGYLGYRTHVVLLLEGSSCRVATAGKRAYRCSLLRAPTRSARSAEITFLSEVRASGAVLVLADGRILEVDSLGRIYTTLWLPASEVILIDGVQAMNLDNPEELVTITRIR